MSKCDDVDILPKICIVLVTILLLIKTILCSICTILEYCTDVVHKAAEKIESKNLQSVNKYSSRAISRWFYLRAIGYDNQDMIENFRIIFCSTDYSEIVKAIKNLDQFLLKGKFEKSYSDEYLIILKYAMMIYEICKNNKIINENLKRYNSDYFEINKN